MNRPVVALLLTVTLPPLVAGGCGGEAYEPSSSATVEAPRAADRPTTPKATSPRTPVAGTADPTMRTPGAGQRKRAVAFLAAYIREQNKATANGDFSTVERLVAPTCRICNESMHTISGEYRKGNRMVGGRFEEPEYDVVGEQAGHIVIAMVADVSAAKVVDDGGRTVRTYPSTTGKRVVYTVGATDGTWRVVEGDGL